jgi:hypothetical protein
MGRNSNSYSTRGEPQVAQLLDTEIDFTTLAAGQVLTWEATEEVWINAAGGGGGGIVGTDDDALFKQGGNANTFTNGITRDPANSGRALCLDTANLRLGVGGGNNAVNPVNTLEVDGAVRVKNAAEEIVLDSNSVGLINAGTNLKLYSNNDTSTDASVEVNGNDKSLFVGGTMQVNFPSAFDAPNGTNELGLFKLKLQNGYNLGGIAPFDAQNPLNNALGFPSGRVLVYQDAMPTQNTKILGRIASGVTIAPGSNYVISSFGQVVAFADRMYSDPTNMRSRLVGSSWLYAGAPVYWRHSTDKQMVNVKGYFQGVWQGGFDPANKLDMYVHQYRNGVLLRSYLLCQNRSGDGDCIMSGERTFLGFSASFGEDFEPLTDDFGADVINQSPLIGNDIVLGLAQIEIECILQA